MKQIMQLADGEKITHTGDLVIEGNVGRGAVIDLRDGALTVKGNIDSNAQISVQISEELRNKNAVSGLVIGGGSVIMSGVRIGGGVVSYGSYTKANLCIGNRYIGGVNINNRIFTDGQVEDCGRGVYVITAADTSDMLSFFNNNRRSSAQKPTQLVTAKIDGKTYKGYEIRVEGSTVTVDNQQVIVDTSSLSSADSEPRMPLKVTINGKIGDNVYLSSDAEIQANAIGKNCTIVSTYDGITATNVDDRTTINVRNAIELTNVGSDCKLVSKQYGLKAKNIGYRTIVEVRDAINVSDIYDFCALSSQQYGINAENIGQGVTIKVHDAIAVGNIGVGSTLSSQQYGIKAKDVADKVTIQVRDAISLRSVDHGCAITSQQYGIDVDNNVATCCKLEARDDISVGGIGDHTQITSKQGKVKASDAAGNSIVIQARESVHLKDVGNNAKVTSSQYEVSIRNIGNNANISAKDGIDIDGTCPNPSSLNLVSKGKIRRPKQAAAPAPVVPVMSQNFYATGNYEADLAMAIKASQISSNSPRILPNSPASQVGLFSSPAAKPKEVKIPHAYLCPITQEIMSEPVIFTVDGNSYEKSAITEWLTKHRNSPITREEMEPGQTIEKVLKPNRALIDAIDEFKADNPDLFKQNQFAM
ncbi:Ubiquitin fusion degradation protein 2 [Legionella beliardensis]|uniref:Ubiquitin fusion degradation protein 2 n=1 Tax=Legionella beliardensis TaxID=91822 RepID=A0A378HZE3_9GAMM|nr:U-box domain-containing protein [Legionella beliardensis]STX28308.1 Ubiquitin fusion degradation protein 2 [Legionella beliardensis]